MGLDDFTNKSKSDSSDSSDSDSSGTDSNDSSTDNQSDTTRSGGGDSYDSTGTSMEFYGSGNADIGTNPMERKGAMSNFTSAELAKDVDAEISIEYDNIKFYAPIFPLITAEDEYNDKERYILKSRGGNVKPGWNGRVVSCISTKQTKLGKLNKEFIMFHVGSHSKKHAMERIEDLLGEDVDGNTEVYINFFGDAMFMRDMAQANEEYRNDDTVEVDEIGSRVVKKNMLRVGLNKKK